MDEWIKGMMDGWTDSKNMMHKKTFINLEMLNYFKQYEQKILMILEMLKYYFWLMDVPIYGWIDECMDGWMEWFDGCTIRWMDGCRNEGCKDRWMNELMDV